MAYIRHKAASSHVREQSIGSVNKPGIIVGLVACAGTILTTGNSCRRIEDFKRLIPWNECAICYSKNFQILLHFSSSVTLTA